LGISVTALLLAAVVGSAIGLTSGYFGGYIDMVMGRIVDVLYSFPSQILGIFVAGILGPGVFNVILAIGIVFTPVFYRTMRSGVIKEKEREYVEAARSLGMSHTRIMFVHILRNAILPVTVQFTVGLAVAIQLEAALGFLGLGVQPPASSWGSILNDGIKYIFTAPWISILPGCFMVLAVFAFNLLGDGIRDWLDPHSNR
jgi:peptide/nickel transport system permease protein